MVGQTTLFLVRLIHLVAVAVLGTPGEMRF
jgi:hypothetical protein